ncbi:hypothetical protein V8C44DRAFT_324318 [Trichoderma aethiopicum]
MFTHCPGERGEWSKARLRLHEYPDRGRAWSAWTPQTFGPISMQLDGLWLSGGTKLLLRFRGRPKEEMAELLKTHNVGSLEFGARREEAITKRRRTFTRVRAAKSYQLIARHKAVAGVCGEAMAEEMDSIRERLGVSLTPATEMRFVKGPNATASSIAFSLTLTIRVLAKINLYEYKVQLGSINVQLGRAGGGLSLLKARHSDSTRRPRLACHSLERLQSRNSDISVRGEAVLRVTRAVDG